MTKLRALTALRFPKVLVALVIACIGATSVGVPAASAATNPFVVSKNTAACIDQNYYVAHVVTCSFDTVNVLNTPGLTRVERIDSAEAYFPNLGRWVAQPVEHRGHWVDCRQSGMCSIAWNAGPVLGLMVTSTYWADLYGTGTTTLSNQGTATITPGFSWIHLHSDLCYLVNGQWNHATVDHYYRSDLSFYS